MFENSLVLKKQFMSSHEGMTILVNSNIKIIHFESKLTHAWSTKTMAFFDCQYEVETASQRTVEKCACECARKINLCSRKLD